MKNMRFNHWLVLAAIVLGGTVSAVGANTAGTATFTVRTTSYGGTYDPNNVAVVWVVDGSNKFVKTLCRHAASRISYLSRWSASRGSYTNVDGTTSATLTSQPQTHTVVWNCRDTNNAVVPDGTYYFKVEYTSQNGAGPYLTNGVGFLKGTTAVTTNYANYGSMGGSFTGMSLTYTPILPDVGVTALSPSSGSANSTVPVVVGLSNRTASATPAFAVVLSNLTSAVQIGTQTVATLAANAATNLTFSWNTAGLAAGAYVLQAQVPALSGETNVANNVLTNGIVLIGTVHDVAVNAITVSSLVPPGISTNVGVAVSNAGNAAESFTLALTDLATAQTIGSRAFSGFAAGASSNVVFGWSTTNAAIGYHPLQAAATVVSGETATANNTNTASVIVANGLETNVLIARGAEWKYLNDGLDISGAPWTLAAPAGYYDGFWSAGAAPLGFGAEGIATTIGTAPVSTPGTVLAADAASNALYASSWTNGMNGGAGFGAWQLAVGGTGGHFTWTSTGNAGGSGGIDTGGRSWGLWASSGTTEAVRPLAGGGLATGQILQVSFDNGLVASGRSAGIGLRNAAGSNLWEFYYYGAAAGGTTTNLSENFAGFTAVSGSTDRAAALDTYLQTAGWTGSKVYENAGTAKLGTASALGYLTTPTVNLSANGGQATLAFDLLKYGSDTGPMQVLHAADGSTFVQVGGNLTPPASLATQTVQITNGTAASKIQLTAVNAANNRFYLDNVRLTQSGGGAGLTNYVVNDARGPTGTSIPFTSNGLQIAFRRTGATNYLAAVISGASTTQLAGATMAQADSVPAQVRCWNWEAGSGSNYDVFVNSLLVSTAASVSSVTNPVTVYFRKEFTVDAVPIAVTGLVRREDGVALYLNGQQIDQHNLPVGAAINGALPASSDLSAAAAAEYVAFALAPSNLVVGRNWLAAEVHLASAGAASAAFDAEIRALQNTSAKTYAVAPVSLTPDGAVQSGDRLGASVVLTNSGNAAAACTVLIRDAATGAILAAQSVPALVAGETAEIHLDWSTLGLATGSATLQAYTVVNGVTNFAGAVSNAATISAIDFGARRVNADGSVGGPCRAVAVSGSTVFLGCGSTLEIWDAANPASPARIGAIRLPGLIENLVAGGSAVYAAAGAAGVQVVDVSTPSAPVHVATFDTSGNAHRLALSGSTLHVADGLGGVRSLNVANPASPALAGAYATAGSARAVLATGSSVVVLDSDEGVQIVTTNAAATLVGAEPGVSAGLALAGTSGAVIASDANGGLFRVTTSDPAAPAISIGTRLPAAGQALAVSPSALYVAAGAAGLLSVDPATLAVQSTNAVDGEAADAALSGSTLYVAAGFGGCRIFSVASPFAPALLGTFGHPARAVDADVAGSTLLLAGDEAGLQIHSLTNVANPEWVATVAASTNPRCLAVTGTLAFVAEALGDLKIYDVHDPAAPSLLGTAAADGLATIRRLAVSGSRLAATDGHRINLFDVSDPAAPTALASNVPPGYVFDLAADSNRFYAACGGAGLRILDNSALGLVGSHATSPDSAMSVALSGDNAYVGDGGTTLWTISVTNPAAPVLVQTSTAGGFGGAAAQSLVYGVDGRRAGTGLDVSAPLTPVSSLSLSNLTFALRIRAAGDLVLVAEDEAGLALFSAANSADANHNGIPDAIDQQIADADPGDALSSIWDVQPGDDFDGDGLSNLAEVLAGTSPVDADSYFALSAINPVAGTGGSQFVVRWYGVAGKTYTLHKSTNLLSGFTAVQTGIVGSYPVNSFTDTVAGAAAYYMISVP